MLEQFDKIKWSRYDEQTDLLLAWHGGHGIHGYDNKGTECLFWNLGGADNPTLEDVQENIEKHIEAQDYLELY